MGIYVCFLSWGYLQERLSSTFYRNDTFDLGGGEKFRYYLVLNAIQAIIASILSASAILFQGEGYQIRNLIKKLRDLSLLSSIVRVSLATACSSPIGYASLKHISYLTMLLGKACKLVPVMLVSSLLYGRRYPARQYAMVLFVTFGVLLFMSNSSDDDSKNQNSTSSVYGLMLLSANLFLDGLVNAWQDQLFAGYKLTSLQVMLAVNFGVSCLLYAYLMGTFLVKGELWAFVHFIQKYPRALVDMLAFCICGACGQLAVFGMLEHFGAVRLVTITVTRKMATMALSVVAFGHRLSGMQALGMACVALALLSETFTKNTNGTKKA